MWESSVVFACFCVYSVTSFNVDSFNYALYNGLDSTSMFGFSMALHKEGNNGWLIVGAPEAQSQHQRRVYKGGVVYKCPTNRDGGCTEIPFDTKGDMYDQNGQQLDNKTEQWFGATVSSSGREEGSIVACAPRYTWYPRKKTRRDPVGTCYTSNALFNQFNEYSPCRTYQWGYHRQGSCQAGFSAAINSIGDRLFIGAPGSWYWQGQMYSVDAHATFEFKPDLFSATYGAEGQVHQQSLEKRPAVFSTTEGTEQDDDSYMGYSTIVGDFLGNGNSREESIAVGMPRGNFLKGVVLLFTWNLTDFRHFTSNQLGCYFGYSLAASDVDGDGKVDLIVGAPMYTVPNNKDNYDVGRVYVIYHQSEKGKFMVNDTLDGFNTKSRFGQALASLGDINQDGYEDFAVGAPYDGKNNRGAVYIYHGSSKGVRKKYSQVIYAEDVIPLPTTALATFGFSITGGLDLDGNEYPDMAIGAYLSNKAFFFRSRPVIRVDAWVEFLTDGKSVDITKPNYALKTQKDAQAVKTAIQFCARYYGKGIPSSINLDLQYILDSKKLLTPRMGFVDNEGQNIRNDTIRLYQNRTQCTNETKAIQVYVKSDIRDKLSPLVAEVKYWMKTDGDLHPSFYEPTRNPRSPLVPILDLNSPPSKKDSLKIANNCGDDNVCIPNLNLEVTPGVDKYMLVSGEKLALEIFVSNTGEDAFESTLEVKYPDTLYYDTNLDIRVETYVLCNTAENNTVKCDIGNPIPRDKVVHFKMFWKPYTSVNTTPSTYDFVVSVNSSNPENPNTRRDNTRKVSVGILYSYQLELNGRAYPSDVHVIPAHYTVNISTQTPSTSPEDRLPEEAIGPQVIHVFFLTNEGKTKIEEAEVFFAWPAHTMTEDHEDFLYLVEPPNFSVTENLNIQCGPIPANYRDFRVLSSKKSIWERYHIALRENGGTSSEQVGPLPPPTGAGNKVTAVVGGGAGKTDENIDRKVANSGDSSSVHPARNKTFQTGSRVEIYQGEGYLGRGNFQQIRVGNLQYHYRCLDKVNGREREVPCGEGVTRYLQLGGEWSGGIQRQCKREMYGRWEEVDCGTLFQTSQTGSWGRHKEATVQIFEGGSEFDRQYQRIGNLPYFYRCIQRIGGVEKEIDCGHDFSLTVDNMARFLRGQQVGDLRIQSECKKMIDGQWRVVDCAGLFEEGGQIDTEKTIQIAQAQTAYIAFGAESLYHRRVGNTDYFYRCLQLVHGVEREVDCGHFVLTPANITTFLQYGGGPNVHTDCKKMIDGQWRIVNCATLYETGGQTTWRQTQTTVQIVQAQTAFAAFGAESLYYRRVGNTDYFYRCLQHVNGIEREVDCGTNFVLTPANITTFLQQGGGGVSVQRECKKMIDGQWRIVNCGNLFETPTTTSRPTEKIVQIAQAQTAFAAFGAESLYYRRVGNTDYFYRCLQEIYGVEREVDCGLFVLTPANITTFLQYGGGESVESECKKMIDGQWRMVNCATLLYGTGGQTTWGHQTETTVQVVQGQGSIGVGSQYRRIGNTEYFYRCLQKINGVEREVDCGPNFSLTAANITRFLQGGGQGVQVHRECKRLIDGDWRIVDCGSLYQTGGTQTETTVQVVQGQSAFGAGGQYRRVGNTEYFYRCIKRVNGVEEEVNCGPNFLLTAANITRFLQQGGQGVKVHSECKRMINGEWRVVDCASLYTNQQQQFGTSGKLQTGGNVRYRCFILNDRYHQVDCGSAELLQNGGAESTGAHRCVQSVDGGAEEDISCREAVEAYRRQSQSQYGGTYNYGQYSHGYANQSQYGYGNEDLYQGRGHETNRFDEYDENSSRRGSQSNYDTRGATRRDSKTYGIYGGSRNNYHGQNVIENAALGTGGFQAYAFDVNPLPSVDNYQPEEPVGRDNVPTERSSSKQGFYGRKKRQVPDRHPSIAEIKAQYPCHSVQCIYMRCTVQNLEQGKQLAIALRGRVNGRIFNNLSLTDSISFSTLMVARVRKLPNAGAPTDQEPVYHEITTTVKKTEAELKPETVPLWVVVLSAVAGTIILLLLVFLLYKLGFFKRNRPSSAPERQPLNRNGYHHDDEVL